MNTFFPPNAGKVLLPLIRAEIAHVLNTKSIKMTPLPEWVQKHGATFVTITKQSKLRGCVGTIIPYRSILLDCLENGLHAATKDPRFSPITCEELEEISLEISILSPLECLQVKNEADAIAQIRKNTDGLLLEYNTHASTLLPQVWQTLPDEQAFLRRLKEKAGLSSEFWADEIRLSRYSVSSWKE